MDSGILVLGGRYDSEAVVRIADWAKKAEDLGFTHFWVADTPLLVSDPYVNLTACALKTSKIKLGIAVTPAHAGYRHPVVTANAISALAEVSGGRTILGLGAGDSGAIPLGFKRASIEQMEEALISIRGFLSGKQFSYRGTDVMPARAARRNVPIYLAASGPKALRLAGRLADGVIIAIGVAPEYIRFAIEQIRIGCESANRDFSKIAKVCEIAWSVSDDDRKAKDVIRSWAASMMRMMPVELVGAETRKKFVEAYDFSHHMHSQGEYAKMATDEIVEKLAIAGTTQDCSRQLEKLLGLPIDQILILPQVGQDKAAILESFSRLLVRAKE